MSSLDGRSLLLFSAFVLGAVLPSQAQTQTSECLRVSTNTVQVAMPRATAISPAQAAFNRADTSGDGRLSRQELEHFPAMAPHFKLIDTDHDGFISFDELRRAAS